jgi:hypothetical protein
VKRAVLLCTLLAACGPAEAGPTTPQPDDSATRIRAFEATRDEALRDLAAIDRRLAARARVAPRDDDLRRVALGALDDQTLAAIDGVIDPFSFEARARGLAAVKRKVDASPSGLPGQAGLERELLVRLVDEEIARLDEERRLPWSASALVRGVVETWVPPKNADQAAARDRWLTRRLAEIRESLAQGELDVIARARELDDALDALERKVDAPGFQATTGELVKLRESLESFASRSGGPPRSRWDTISRGLSVHLGIRGTEEDIGRALANADSRLRALAEAAIPSSRITPTVLAQSVGPHMFEDRPCGDAVAESPIRSMLASPERTASCNLRHALREGGTAAQQQAAELAALHDHVAVAWWAFDLARGASTLSQAVAKHPLIVVHTPDVTTRLERIAVARPIAAIGAGFAAAMLAPTVPEQNHAAPVWDSLGDVPFDVVERALRTRPRS